MPGTVRPVNYGWPCADGTSAAAGYSTPLQAFCNGLAASVYVPANPYFAYADGNPVAPSGDTCAAGPAVVGGVAFYESGRFPTVFDGSLMFADTARGCIWTVFNGTDGLPDPATRTTLSARAGHPSDLQVHDGDVYYVDATAGTLHRLRYERGNVAPTPGISASPISGGAPLAVSFSASGSESVGPLTYSWDLNGDGTFGDATTLSPTATYTVPGTYLVRVRASGSTGLSSVAAVTITVVPPDTVPPVISGVLQTGVAATNATISWTTNEIADSAIEYGPTTAYGSTTTRNAAFETTHTQLIAGLVGNGLYHFRVRSRDVAGNLAVSGDFTMVTAGDPAVPVAPTLNRAHPLAQGLIGAWHFFSGSAVNLARTDRSGVWVGGAAPAFTADGFTPTDSSALDVVDGGLYDFTNQPFSIAVDFRYQRTNVGTPIILARGLNNGWSLFANVSDYVGFLNNRAAIVVSAFSLVPGQFYRMVVVWDGSTVTLHGLPGGPQSRSMPAFTAADRSNLLIGRHYLDGRAMNMPLSRVAFWNRALAASEVVQVTGSDPYSYLMPAAPPAADTTPPVVTRIDPANGATASVSGAIAATFSKPLTGSSVNATTVTLRDEANAIIPSSVVYDVTTLTARLQPSSALGYSAFYTATVKGGGAGVEDVAGNPLAADVSWAFSTIPPPDTTPPTIMTVAPANASSAVNVGAAVSATFSESMMAASINAATVTLRDLANNLVPASVTYNVVTRTVRLQPTTSLSAGAPYIAIIRGGAAGVKDLAGNSMASDRVWTFSAALPVDATPPAVSAVYPVAGAIAVSVTSSLTATFSEAMTGSSITAASVTLRNAANDLVTATVTYDAAVQTVRLQPSSPLTTSASYTATVKGGATGVKDAAGNALVNDVSWTFTTATSPAGPQINFSQPLAQGMTGAWHFFSGSSTNLARPDLSGTWTGGAPPALTGDGFTPVDSAALDVVDGRLYDFTTQPFTIAVDFRYQRTTVGTPVILARGITNGWTLFTNVSDYVGFFNNRSGTFISVSGLVPGQFYRMLIVWDGSTIALHGLPGGSVTRAMPAFTASERNDLMVGRQYLAGQPMNMPLSRVAFWSRALGSSEIAQITGSDPYAYMAATQVETTPPTITGVSPVNGVTVSANAAITATFSEPMLQSTMSATTVTLRNAANVVVPAAVVYDTTIQTVRLQPTNVLPVGAYTATVRGGATGVKDLNGNPLAADSTWTFSVAAGGDTSPPTVTTSSPANGATSVSVIASVTATFSKAITPGTITTSTVLLRDGTGASVSGVVTYDATTRSVRLQPASLLKSGTSFTATLKGGTAGIKDLRGNALAGDVTWTFTTPPSALGQQVNPAHPLAQNLIAVWHFFAGSSTNLVRPDSSGSWTSGSPPTFTSDGFTPTEGVALQVSDGGLYDFTTQPFSIAVDFRYQPSSGTPVLLSRGLSAAWTLQSHSAAPFGFENNKTAGFVYQGGLVPGQFYRAVVVWNGGTLTIHGLPGGPTSGPMVPFTASDKSTLLIGAYYVPGFALKMPLSRVMIWNRALTGSDVAQITGSDPYSYMMPVVPADPIAPIVAAVSPSNGLADVSVSAAVTVTFNEAMQASSLTGSTITLRDAANAIVPASVSYDAATLTARLQPGGVLTAGTRYTAELRGGGSGAQDLAGNPLDHDFSWTFTTAPAVDTTAPAVVGIGPANGTSGVSTSAKIMATFSEALAPSTVSSASVTLRNGAGAIVPAIVGYDPGTQVVRLQAASPLAYDTVYTATMKGGAAGIRDVAGNALAGDVIWTFSTVPPPDTTPATVTAVSPASGSDKIGVSSTVVATFSEALTASSVTGTTVTLRDAANILVAATVTYDAATQAARLQPIGALRGSTVYTATVMGGTGGVRNLAGIALASDVSWTFATAVSSSTGSINFDHPLAQGMIGAWHFFAGSATNLVRPDLSGTWTASSPSAFTSDGFTPTDASSLNVVDGGLYDFTTQPFSIVVDFRFQPTSSGTPVFVARGIANGWTLLAHPSGYVGFFNNRTGTFVAHYGLVAGQFYRMAVVWNGSTVSIQGLPGGVVSQAMPAFTASERPELRIGRFGLDGYSLNMPLSRVAFWSRALSAAEVAQLTGDDAYAYLGAAPPDTTPPAVTSVSPINAASGVSASTAITASFSRALDASAVTGATMTLRTATDAIVAGTVTYDAATQTARLQPSELTAGTQYTATIIGGASGVRDLAGNALAGDVKWSFTTAAASSGPQINFAHPLAQGMTGAWHFFSGTAANLVRPDLSGTWTGGTAPAFTSDGFTPTDAAARDVVDGGLYDFTSQPFSIAVDFRFQATSVGTPVFLARGVANGWTLLGSPTGYVGFLNNRTGTFAARDGLVSGQFYRMVITWDGATVTIYGLPDGTASRPMPAFTAADRTDLLIGRFSLDGRSLNMPLSRVLFWNRALTAAEAAQITGATPYSYLVP
jgi:hypothetical protein